MNLLKPAFEGKKFPGKAVQVLPILAAAFAIFMIARIHPQYLYPEHLEYNALLGKYTDSPCIYMTDDTFIPLTYDFYQLIVFDEYFTTDNTASDKMLDYIGSFDSDDIVVFIDTSKAWSSGYEPEVLLPELQDSTGYENCSPLFSNGFSATYVLSK